ncbi:MAG: hypothetical protein LUE86_08795 [Clostridiales bacterium]|nr:hypothetical protein [Clostridiales bacterium]
MEPTKRGWVYKWREGAADERRVVVVSPDFRGNEKMISALMFGSAPLGRDVVEVHNKALGDDCYLHVGMMTYVKRTDLSDKPLFQLSERQLAHLNKQLCIQLGLCTEELMAELNFYQKKCNELIQQYGNVNFAI